MISLIIKCFVNLTSGFLVTNVFSATIVCNSHNNNTHNNTNNLPHSFPQLSESSFANSRDSNFWRTLLKATAGRGVDVVLNSLSEDKLQASVQLLAQHGRFLEIGKFDLSNDSPLGASVLSCLVSNLMM